MKTTAEKQVLFSAVSPDLRRWVDGFLLAKRTQNLSPYTLRIYSERARHFADFCESRGVSGVEAIDPTLLREYLLHLEEAGHNPGGVHQYYRVVRTFLRWYEEEAAPEGWRNPIKRVGPPRLSEEPLEPVEVETVRRMVEACESDSLGLRDKAILLTLLDTGLRASELTGLDVGDFDLVTGAISVRHGKGGKSRMVFAGQAARKAIRAYMRTRSEKTGALFITRSGGRLTYLGLRSMVARRAGAAGVRPPPIHSFRRAFALEMIRAGADLISLQRLMGHADLSLLKRYVKQNTNDLRAVHALTSPVDRAGR